MMVDGMVIFTFMCDIKNDLQKLMPDALVTVQPHSYCAVEILVSWRKGTQKMNIGQLISIGEITERPKLAVYYTEKILKMKDEADDKPAVLESRQKVYTTWKDDNGGIGSRKTRII